MNHFVINGNHIDCWNGNDGWTHIAEISNMRQCRFLVRQAAFEEDVESIFDKFLGETVQVAKVICPEVDEKDGYTVRLTEK